MRILAALLLLTVPAWGHDAPAGWSYSVLCCSNRDCRQEASGEIKETPQGYRVTSTVELIQYGDGRIKQSGDEYFHRCAIGGDFAYSRSLCLYVPQRSF